MGDPRIRPLEGQHIGYLSGCVCAICEASPLRTLEMHARQFVAAVGDSQALAALRMERDDLAKLADHQNRLIIDRNEEYRRLWDVNQRNESELAILKLEIERLNRALIASEQKLEALENAAWERSEHG